MDYRDDNFETIIGGDISGTGDEDTTITGTLTAFDADGLSDGTVFSVTTSAGNGVATIDAASGAWSYTPSADYNGNDSFIVTITDDDNNTATQEINITVTPVNDAPVLDPIGNQTVNELETLTFTATASDSDIPADTLTFTLDAASIAAGMSIDGTTGAFSWTPSESDGGSVPNVTITVTDSGTGNLVDAETFTITVNDINTAPVLDPIGNQTVNELETLTFTATASDSDIPADTLTFTLDAASIAAGMSIDGTTGAFSWTPSESDGGSVPNVTITVTDSGTGNLVDAETFTITVNDINTAPVLDPIGNQTVNELETLTFTATASDSDIPADTLTFTLDAASIAAGMSIDGTTGAFSWTPSESDGGSVPNVTITVTDSGTGNLVDAETFTITVNDINTAPVLDPIGNQTVNELETLTFTATASDSDIPADTLTFTLDAASIAAGMSIDGTTGAFSWTPSESDGGSVPNVTITVTDSGTGNLVDAETFTITVNDINTAPVLDPIGNQTVNELETLTFTATASDSDIPADTLTFTLDAASIAAGMSIDGTTGAFSWTPSESDGGSVPNVTITVTDSGTGNLVDAETFTITVNDINTAPVLDPIGNQTVNELETLTFTATASDSDIPADTLTFTLDAASIAAGMSIDGTTGAFSWTPSESDGGSVPNVTITVTDSGTGNLVDAETFTITVNDINTAPVLDPIGNQTVNELETLTFTATASDSDIPADTLTFTLDAASIAAGMSIDGTTGAFSWTPSESDGGSVPNVTITVTDSGTGNLVDAETFTITVNDINTAPVLDPIGNQTVNELETLTFTATASDSDIPADTLTFTLDAASIAAGMSIDGTTGAFSWTPSESDGGSVPNVTITVTDSGTGNLVDAETFTITVNDINTAPVLDPIGNQTVNELETLTFTATASDSDIPADTLTFTLDAASIAAGMSIDGTTGAFSWTPSESDGGSVPNVTITVTDSGTGNLVDAETFTITVNDINTAPVLDPIGNQTVNELETLTFTATASDSDIPADTLTFTLDAASIAAGMSIDGTTGAFSWTPSESDGGSVPNVTITVTDSGTGNLVDAETFTITVNDINTAPVLDPIGNQTVNELETLTFTATASDSDIPADTLTFTLDAASIAAGMSIDGTTGAFSWTPSESDGGSVPNVTITVTDSGTGNLVDAETFTITVNDINTAPVLDPIGNQTVNELETLTFTATASDSDIPADTLTFTLDAASIAAGMSIDGTTGAFSWTPSESDGGSVPNVTITVTDSGTGNLVDAETFTITVNDINTAPVLDPIGNQTVNELETLTFTATASDSDIPADTLTFTLDAASIAAGMSIDGTTGAFSWTPSESDGGSVPNVTITVTDSGTGNLVDAETFTITVNDINTAPVLDPIGNQTVNELETLTFTATASDSDIPADTLTFTLDAASIAAGMSIDGTTGAFSWTPSESDGGSVPNVTITVTDSGTGNLVDAETFTITVNDINTAPVLDPIGNQTVNELETLTFTATASDSDIPADTLTFTLDAASIAAGMSIDGTTGAFSWTPSESDGGSVPNVTITVTDSGTGNLVDAETFTITVNDINTAPVLDPIGNQTVNELETLTFTATASDSDIPADTLTFTLDAASIAAGMSIDGTTGAFSWTPSESDGGSVPNVTITVTDSGTGNLVDAETFTITVNDINTAPVLDPIGNQTVNELETLTFTATASDSDIPADTLTFTLDAASIAAGMSIDGTTGAFSWTPSESDGGSVPNVTITVTDSGTGNLVDAETFTITVNDINTAPVLDPIGNQTVNELETLTFTATASDSDIPADTLTFTLDAASIAAGMSIDGTTGAFSWTPSESDGGSVPNVTITVTDSGTGNLVDAETFTITVNDINTAPVLDPIGNQTVNELETLTFTATASDSDIPADTLTFTLDAASIAAGMSIDGTTGAFSWTPSESDGGSVPNVTITVTDSGTGNLVDAETFTITVNDINTAPVLDPIGNQTVNELETLTFTATASDSDIPADTLTFTLDAASIAAGMSIDGTTGAFSWTPSESDGGSVPNVTITVTDSGTGNLVDAETFTITVNDINMAPVAIDDSIVVNEDTQFVSTINLNANDTDADADILSVIEGTYTTSQGGTLVLASDGSYVYSPPTNFNGVDTVNYTVTDGSESDIGRLTVTVMSINDAPIAVNDSASTTEDNGFNSNINLNANDIDYDGDTLSVGAGTFTTSQGGIFVVNPNGSYGYSPAANFYGVDTVNYTLSDGILTDIGTLTINVAPVNDAPVLAPIGSQSVDELDSLSFTVSATDIDAPIDTLTYSLDAASLAAGMSIDPITGVFSWNPTSDQTSSISSITIIVTDSGTGNLIDSETLFIEVVRTANAGGTSGSVIPGEDLTTDVQLGLLEENTLDNVDRLEDNSIEDSFEVTITESRIDIKNQIFNDYENIDFTVLSDVLNRHSVSDIVQESYASELESLEAVSIDTTVLNSFGNGIASENFYADLDKMYKEIDKNAEKEKSKNEFTVEVASGISISLTAGFVAWLFRSGSLIASLFATMPMWRDFDPVSILSEDEAEDHKSNKEHFEEPESVEHIFEKDRE